MNTREKRKKERIDGIKRMLEKEEIDTDELVSMMVVNHGISKALAREEVNAVKSFLNAK